MDRISRRLRRHIYSARAVEGFVKLIVAGGIALIGGLWVARLSTAGSIRWWSGIGLVVVAIGAIAWGISSEVEY